MTERERLVRLIDRSPAHFCNGCNECPEERADSVEKLADYLLAEDYRKASDVAEVRHGSWELHKDGSGTCSECHFMQKSVWDFDNWQNFCGHCGAKMDGERN